MTTDQARTFVFEHLRTLVGYRHRPTTTELVGIERGIRPLAERDGMEVEWNGVEHSFQGMDSVNVRAALSELETAGVIVWGRGAMQAGPPHLQVTEFGLQCLRDGRINPYDADGYIAALVARVPDLDPTARAHLQEALECLRRSCYRACAVMLGGASEAIMLTLFQSVHDALQDERRKATFARKAVNEVSIRRRFEHFRGELDRVRPTLPCALEEDLDLRLDGIFALIRAARNDAGHPNIHAVSRETVHGNLLLFPSYGERAHDLIRHFTNHPIQ